jgi:predicted metalloprotease
MRWEEGQSQGDVEDRRGMSPAVAGGGAIGLVVMLLAYFLTGDARQAQQIAQQVGRVAGPKPEIVGEPPKDGVREFSSKILGFTNEAWNGLFPEKYNRPYEPPRMVLFTGQVDSEGCGVAPSAVGPFYCPASRKLFVDPTFFDELEQKLGGSKADFSKAYVIAHEVGHHVQNLLGYNRLLSKYKQQEGENSGIRLELQADYLAGVCWRVVESQYRILEPGDIEAAITTARAIGDDRLQKKSRGWVSPESFNHGTAAQRLKYFMQGFKSGDASRRALDHFFNPEIRPLDL